MLVKQAHQKRLFYQHKNGSVQTDTGKMWTCSFLGGEVGVLRNIQSNTNFLCTTGVRYDYVKLDKH